jgi:hypothetical protein
LTVKHPFPQYPEDKTDIVVTFLAYSNEHGRTGEEHAKLNWFPLEQQYNMPKMHPTTLELLKVAWKVVETK